MDDKQSVKKIGIFGGTFNPIHIGHLILAEWVLEAAKLEEIRFVPTGCSYMKTDGTKREEHSMHRYRMTELAVSGRNGFYCSDVEIHRKGPSYTYQTLELLKKEEPFADFHFIMGADCLFTIEHWKCPEKIFNSATLVVAVRNHISLAEMEEKSKELESRFHGKIQLFPFPSIDISSTDIRRRVKEGKSIRYQVSDPVLSYIVEHCLYV